MKEQQIWKVRSCPGYRLSNAKEQMTPIHKWWLSCYCTLIAWGIVLLEFFLLQCCASWPHILRGGVEKLQAELIFWDLLHHGQCVLLCHFCSMYMLTLSPCRRCIPMCTKTCIFNILCRIWIQFHVLDKWSAAQCLLVEIPVITDIFWS